MSHEDNNMIYWPIHPEGLEDSQDFGINIHGQIEYNVENLKQNNEDKVAVKQKKKKKNYKINSSIILILLVRKKK